MLLHLVPCAAMHICAFECSAYETVSKQQACAIGNSAPPLIDAGAAAATEMCTDTVSRRPVLAPACAGLNVLLCCVALPLPGSSAESEVQL